MKPRSYLVIGTIITITLLVVGIVDYYQNKQLNFYEAKNVIRIVKSYDEMEEDLMINDGKWLVLKTKDTIQSPYLENENLFNNMTVAKVFGERYFRNKTVIKNENKNRLIGQKYVIENYRKELVPVVASDLQKGEAVEGLVYIYKVEKTGLKKWKTIDLFEIAKEHGLQGIPGEAYSISEDGEEFSFDMEYEKDYELWKRYTLNIETEELILYQDTKKEKKLQVINMLRSCTNLNKRPVLKESGLEYSGFVPVITFEITENQKQSNVLLMEKYPELLDMQKGLKHGEKIRIYCLVDQPDVKEILTLLTPKEQDPFSYGEKIIFNRDEDVNGNDLGTVVLHSFDQLEKESTELIQRFEEIDQMKENENGAE